MKGEQYGYIYLLYNTMNGKYYVGKTTSTVEQRWKGHVLKAKRSTVLMGRAIRKYGRNAFEVHTLTTANSREQLDQLERLWIINLRSYDPTVGYNMTFGGEGGVPTEAVRQKISERKRGRKGTPPSTETRHKLSTFHKANPNASEFKKGQIPWNKGRKATSEACHNQSLAHMKPNPSKAAVKMREYRERKRAAECLSV